ncbi:MAG: [FeFe] hydrogenase H-cluster maturation GTPase HydF [Bacteroidales bacterium]|nr:[FeFe] hydrogenase H-cluster maturation GTPase HydF [Bacteroidales bacterium]
MKTRENRPHIGVFGRRNYGKSSLINALTGQETAIVSPEAGTTTDPVKKSLEIFGLGPVVLVDTAGIDDEGDLGKLRIAKSLEMLKIVDFAIVVTNNYVWGSPEETLVAALKDYATPFLIVNNKSDEISEINTSIGEYEVVNVSAASNTGIEYLLSEIKRLMPPTAYHNPSLLEDIVSEKETVVLVAPIDSEAPEGRLILPQVQTIRSILDRGAIAVVLQVDELSTYLANHPSPKLVVTDSQVFDQVADKVPAEIPLTSFSILLARQKGDFENYIKGTPSISRLQEGNRILILESCTHQTSCEDIGRVKIPRLLQKFTGKQLDFTFVSGLDEVPSLSDFSLVVQCGGCMVTRKQLLNRLKPAVEAGIPVTNYGMLLAYVNGIFNRAVELFV